MRRRWLRVKAAAMRGVRRIGAALRVGTYLGDAGNRRAAREGFVSVPRALVWAPEQR